RRSIRSICARLKRGNRETASGRVVVSGTGERFHCRSTPASALGLPMRSASAIVVATRPTFNIVAATSQLLIGGHLLRRPIPSAYAAGPLMANDHRSFYTARRKNEPIRCPSGGTGRRSGLRQYK